MIENGMKQKSIFMVDSIIFLSIAILSNIIKTVIFLFIIFFINTYIF